MKKPLLSLFLLIILSSCSDINLDTGSAVPESTGIITDTVTSSKTTTAESTSSASRTAATATKKSTSAYSAVLTSATGTTSGTPVTSETISEAEQTPEYTPPQETSPAINRVPENTTKTTAANTQTQPLTTTAETTVTVEVTQITEEINNGQLVRILDYIPEAVIDLRYATPDNFTGEVIYDDTEAYLCYGTVKKLINVQAKLKEYGYRIVIWDAYRSPEAQQRLWDVYPDPAFVADPRNGITSHSRGNTIDITIAYEDGTLLEMPSAFDEFTAAADRNYSDVSKNAADNSRLLESIMYGCGFTGYIGEWWDYSDTERYELTGISS